MRLVHQSQFDKYSGELIYGSSGESEFTVELTPVVRGPRRVGLHTWSVRAGYCRNGELTERAIEPPTGPALWGPTSPAACDIGMLIARSRTKAEWVVLVVPIPPRATGAQRDGWGLKLDGDMALVNQRVVGDVGEAAALVGFGSGGEIPGHYHAESHQLDHAGSRQLGCRNASQIF